MAEQATPASNNPASQQNNNQPSLQGFFPNQNDVEVEVDPEPEIEPEPDAQESRPNAPSPTNIPKPPAKFQTEPRPPKGRPPFKRVGIQRVAAALESQRLQQDQSQKAAVQDAVTTPYTIVQSPPQSLINNTSDESNTASINTTGRIGEGANHIYDTENHKGGLTVAFRKVSQFGSGKMVQCAVNTCSNKDAFNKKIGAKGALEKFFNGETIELPILEIWTEEDLNWAVKQSFTQLYNVISSSW